MDEKKGKPACPRGSRPGSSITRREFLSTSSKLVAGSVLVAAGGMTPGKALGSTLALPSWRRATAKSDVFVVQDIPAPRYSLAGGILPPGPPDLILQDAGIEAMAALMDRQGSPFFRTASTPDGLVASDSIVVIKINQQWVGAGEESGLGRLSTSTDLIKGLVWRILNHPEGFVGEVVLAENIQNENPGYASRTPANAQDQNQSLMDVITVFQNLGQPVSLQDWTNLNNYLLLGGNLGPEPATSEYIYGNMDDGYVLLNGSDNPPGLTDGYSYPKFLTAAGHYVSMRHGLWDAGASTYHPDRVVLINMPVLKKHEMAGATAAWKNLIGFITCEGTNGSRFPDWFGMHAYFWGFEDASNLYGLVGRHISLIRKPDLNIVDAIWVANYNNWGSKSAVRCNVVLASRDPFAVDWYASEYILRPVVPEEPDSSSLARMGTFRSASIVNQKAAMSTWAGTYPLVDFVAGYSGNTPLPEEQNQMNVFLVSSLGASSLPAIINMLLAD
jgi:hypothetical protein